MKNASDDSGRFVPLLTLALIAAAMMIRCSVFDAASASETLRTMKHVATALSVLLATISTAAYFLPFPPLRWALLGASLLVLSSACAPLFIAPSRGRLNFHDMYESIEPPTPRLELHLRSEDARLKSLLLSAPRAALEFPVRGCGADAQCTIAARFGDGASVARPALVSRPEWLRYELSSVEQERFAHTGQVSIEVESAGRMLALYARDTGVAARGRTDTIIGQAGPIPADGIVFVRFVFTDANGRPLAVMY